jgi:parallel beta-helix repeat protein
MQQNGLAAWLNPYETGAGGTGQTDLNNAAAAACNTYGQYVGGIHVNGSSNVTVANNSCYNNYLDPANNATYRGCIDDNGGSGNTYINNIAVAIPTVATNCSLAPPYAKFDGAIVGNNASG